MASSKEELLKLRSYLMESIAIAADEIRDIDDQIKEIELNGETDS